MKDSTLIIIIVAGAAVLFWAVSSGLINSGIQVPQPAQNYSGYLAASTAPAVSNAINSVLGGLSNSLSGWLSGGGPTAPATAAGTPGIAPASAVQAAVAAAASSQISTTDSPVSSSLISPTFAAGPSGPDLSGLVASVQPPSNSGPVVDPSLSYNATTQNAYDYSGLASANPYDAGYSLDFNG